MTLPLLRPRPAYLWESASWFVPFGIQGVLFPWLVTIVLQGDGTELGLVQASLMLPLVLLLPWSGSFAERSDRHLVLIVCHIGAALPPLLLAMSINAGWLEYWMLVSCGLFYGVMTAMAMPARDAMLYEVSGKQLQTMVAMTTSVQFGVQIFGYILAGQAEWVGAETILVFQAIMLLLGGLVAWRYLPANQRITKSQMMPTMDVLRQLRDTPIPAAMVINMTVGFFYISAHSVAIPLLIRDRFDGGAVAISLGFTVFMVGTVTSNVIIMSFFRLVRLGMAALCGPIAGVIVLAMLIWVPELWLALLLLFFWGMGAGFTIAAGRTLVQEHALPQARARIMALYQLTFLGSAPLGSLVLGWNLDYLGLEYSLIISVVCISLILAGLYLFSNIWKVTTATR